MYTAGNIILLLKIAVALVSVLLVASLVALALKKPKLHGRINITVFVLTMVALIGLELVTRIVSPGMMDAYFQEKDAKQVLYIHLCFAIPSSILLPIMLFTGWTRRIRIHVPMAVLFLLFWIATFITGVFFLPHD